MLAVIVSGVFGWLSRTKGSARTSRMRSARISGPAARVMPSESTTNSSPPSRPTVSVARRATTKRRATAWRISSPASCPSVSLTSLKLSRSMKNAATGCCWRAARTSICAARSWISVRLASPVSESCSAWCASWSCASLRSVTSRRLATKPATDGWSRRSLRTASASRVVPSACRIRNSTGSVTSSDCNRAENCSTDALAVLRVHDVGGLHPHDGLRRQADERRGGGARVGDRTVARHHQGGVRRVLHEGAESLLARPHRPLGPLLLLHRGAGHADDEQQHERAHEPERLRVRGREERRRPLHPDRDLADRDAGHAPQRRHPPRLRPVVGDVLERDERERHDQHRAPPGEVDDGRDGGRVPGHACVEPETTGPAAVPDLERDAQGRDRDEDREPQPERLLRDHPEPLEEQDHDERGRSHHVAEQVGVQPDAPDMEVGRGHPRARRVAGGCSRTR